MDLSNVLPRLSRQPWQMAITVHLPPRSSLFHVYWPRLNPRVYRAFHEYVPSRPSQAILRAHKGCPVSVGTHGHSLAAPGRQVCDIEPRPPWTTPTQTHVYEHGASHASSRGMRGKRSTQYYLARIRVSLYVRIRGCKMYIYAYTCMRNLCLSCRWIREGAVPGGCVHGRMWVRDAFLTPFI